MGEIFDVLFYEPLYNGIIILYHALGDNLALAIIGIALISRTVMIPLTLRQIRMAESGREFSEKVKEIKEKYKDDQEKQNQEMMKIQSQYLPQQLAGCLPMIFQFIIFINIYRVIRNIIDEGAIGFNEVAYSFVDKFPDGYEYTTDLLGLMDMKNSSSDVVSSEGIAEALPYLLLLVGVAAAQFGSMRILMAIRSKRSTKDEKSKKEEKKKKAGEEDFSEILQRSTKQTMFFMPVLLMFIGYGLPSGLSLYWISQSGFVIIQQFVISRLQGDSKETGMSSEEIASETESQDSGSPVKKAKKKKKKKKKKKR